jgi:isoleucyl-tRNA synthetase
LGTVLEVLCRLAAPLLPLVTEAVWRGLTGGERGASVHLCDWPSVSVDSLPFDPSLVQTMDRVREVCSAAHSVRKAQGLRARLPLASLTVAAADARSLEPYRDLIADEVNVKDVRLVTAVDDVAERVLTVVFKVAAPRLGPATQQVAAAARSGDWEVLSDGRARVGGAVLEPGEFELRLRPRAETVSRALPGDDGVVVLDVSVNASLEEEGLARDVVRVVQQARRDAGLEVTDRIRLAIAGPSTVVAAVLAHREWIAEQVLAVSVETVEVSADSPLPPAPAGGGDWQTADLPGGHPVWVQISVEPV